MKKALMAVLCGYFLTAILCTVLQAEVCLVMVVHNHETVIERTLENIKEAVDSICIYNQGCSDDTLVLIDAFKHDTGIPV